MKGLANWTYQNFMTHFAPVVQTSDMEELETIIHDLDEGQMIAINRAVVYDVRPARLIIQGPTNTFFFTMPEESIGTCHEAKPGDQISIYHARYSSLTCFQITNESFVVNSNYLKRNPKGL